ncbi:MAG: hypothetical protein IT371_09975 [Deltaproteobacteria bacterium]|nr:hypothetical protein [Deltaproteobacteria bacterium]
MRRPSETRVTSPTLAQNLGRLCREADFDLVRLGQKARIGYSTARSAAKGLASPRTVQRLAKALGVPTSALLESEVTP